MKQVEVEILRLQLDIFFGDLLMGEDASKRDVQLLLEELRAATAGPSGDGKEMSGDDDILALLDQLNRALKAMGKRKIGFLDDAEQLVLPSGPSDDGMDLKDLGLFLRLGKNPRPGIAMEIPPSGISPTLKSKSSIPNPHCENKHFAHLDIYNQRSFLCQENLNISQIWANPYEIMLTFR